MSDFHGTFVNMLDGFVENEFSFEKGDHILNAINTGEFRPFSIRHVFVEGMLAFKCRTRLPPKLIELSTFVTCECFFQGIRGAINQSSNFVQAMHGGTRYVCEIELIGAWGENASHRQKSAKPKSLSIVFASGGRS